MENVHLVQALYGQQDAIPVRVKQEDDEGDTTQPQPAVAMVETTSTTKAPADATLIKSNSEDRVGESNMNVDGIHPARLHLMNSEDTAEEQVPELKLFAPKGSNKIPLGKKSRVTARKIGNLRFAPEYYLPPAGPYYDHADLAILFGHDFFTPNKCPHCWKLGLGEGATKCGRQCDICGTKGHPGRKCPLLYCPLEWLLENNVPLPLDGFQVQPSSDELKELFLLGLFKVSEETEDIVPVLSHPVAEEFYKDKAAPERLDSLIFEIAGPVPTNETLPEPELYTQPMEQQQAVNTPFGNIVNASLDPRRRDQFLDSTSSVDLPSLQAVASGSNDVAGSIMDVDSDQQVKVELSLQLGDHTPSPIATAQPIKVEAYVPSLDVETPTEHRIQQLNEQVLDLQEKHIAKDRELFIKDLKIRMLEEEIKQLKEGGAKIPYNVGCKRQRF